MTIPEATFNGMGLFTSDRPWIHPARIEETYEIICPIEGDVFLNDGGREISLKPGQLVILRPGILHRGSRYSSGGTVSFYWLHFFAGELPTLPYLIDNFRQTPLLRELMHYANLAQAPRFLSDAIFCHLLALLLCEGTLETGESRLAAEVLEWLRINVNGRTTVTGCAEHFGFNSEHLSRVIAAQYGCRMKTLIDRFLSERAREQLINTDRSVKEIASLLGFPDAGALLRFFKYHEGTTPSAYRRRYTALHLNNH